MSTSSNKDQIVKYWQDQVTAWQESKCSATQWCREQNIKYSTFNYWKMRLLQKTKAAPIFRELVAKPIASGVELRVGSVKIHISPDFDELTLCRLLSSLGAL
tara:strand:- start:1244 stop:1549 length:306 start_codon:yes stop_codon:yes gene_type:complete